MEMRMMKGRGREFEIPSKFKPIIAKLKILREKEEVLRKTCFTRTLIDEKTGKKVIEEGNPLYANQFGRDYLDDQGRKIRYIYYSDNKKGGEVLYRSDT